MCNSELRANLATVWDRVIANRETAIVHRRGAEDVAIMPASELRGLLETAHLLRSPRNAMRLLTALQRTYDNEVEPSSLESLKADPESRNRYAFSARTSGRAA